MMNLAGPTYSDSKQVIAHGEAKLAGRAMATAKAPARVPTDRATRILTAKDMVTGTGCRAQISCEYR
jgi:hypothetical protein